ncbi:hypothetical protein [Streptomyces flaveolus]|uniref:hypothetical protein n=1 Tax=Streptomyces flaveolus TaxID=67297 RepID=UPI00340FE296
MNNALFAEDVKTFRISTVREMLLHNIRRYNPDGEAELKAASTDELIAILKRLKSSY